MSTVCAVDLLLASMKVRVHFLLVVDISQACKLWETTYISLHDKTHDCFHANVQVKDRGKNPRTALLFICLSIVNSCIVVML